MQQPHLFKMIRDEFAFVLNGYVRHPEILDHLDQYIQPPKLGGDAGVVGSLFLAAQEAASAEFDEILRTSQSRETRVTLTGTLVKSTIVAALGGLLFGFDTAVISGTTAGLQSFFALSEEAKGFTVAIAVIGTVFGALFASIPGDKFGRRDSLRGMAFLYLISAIGCAFAWDWYSLLFFRFIGGLGIGGSSVLGPMYIAEIAPAKWRGRLVGFFSSTWWPESWSRIFRIT